MTTLFQDTEPHWLTSVKLRLSERFVYQAISEKREGYFDFFKKPFVFVRDGFTKSDANKLRFAN
ncbi:hypothetical protein [Paraburkholderia bannensis]|uniref:hypothetical protein n=1 Tax=Paraburkholderia bannensis TaxID=765414 RepID=UPI002AC3403D|nr:hypothetical protein [Paraburkholderia bannensis]